MQCFFLPVSFVWITLDLKSKAEAAVSRALFFFGKAAFRKIVFFELHGSKTAGLRLVAGGR